MFFVGFCRFVGVSCLFCWCFCLGLFLLLRCLVSCMVVFRFLYSVFFAWPFRSEAPYGAQKPQTLCPVNSQKPSKDYRTVGFVVCLLLPQKHQKALAFHPKYYSSAVVFHLFSIGFPSKSGGSSAKKDPAKTKDQA